MGLKVRVPANVNAVTSSGDATKACVLGFPSFLLAKLRLKDVMMLLVLASSEPWRFHCPMQGPQALARTTPPILTKASSCPSRAMVSRIFSDPGVMMNSDLALRPFAAASLAIDAERSRSSYDELVHDPMSPTESVSGNLFSLTAVANWESGQALSGVKGPLMWGSSSDKLISMTWSKYSSGCS